MTDYEPDGVAGGMAETLPAPRRNVPREGVFQRVAVAFIRQVLVPPCFITAIVHENELTQNARARARARGMLPGIPDVYVAQWPRISAHIELKWGKNQPSDQQKDVARALGACGIHAACCWSIGDIAHELRTGGFRLVENWPTLVQVYQARAEAAVARAEINAGRPKRASKARHTGRKGSPSQHARIAAARLGTW